MLFPVYVLYDRAVERKTRHVCAYFDILTCDIAQTSVGAFGIITSNTDTLFFRDRLFSAGMISRYLMCTRHGRYVARGGMYRHIAETRRTRVCILYNIVI